MQNQLEDRAYAGFFVRLVAFMVDFLIAAMVGGMLKAPFSTAAALGLQGLRANFLFQYSFLDVVGYLGQAAYFVLMTWFNHATLGKMLMRLEVVTEGKEWTFGNVLYRETVGRFLSSILMAGYLVVLGQKKKQGFHDMLCDTFVVYKNMALRPAKSGAAQTETGVDSIPHPAADGNGMTGFDGTSESATSGKAAAGFDGISGLESSENVSAGYKGITDPTGIDGVTTDGTPDEVPYEDTANAGSDFV